MSNCSLYYLGGMIQDLFDVKTNEKKTYCYRLYFLLKVTTNKMYLLERSRIKNLGINTKLNSVLSDFEQERSDNTFYFVFCYLIVCH